MWQIRCEPGSWFLSRLIQEAKDVDYWLIVMLWNWVCKITSIKERGMLPYVGKDWTKHTVTHVVEPIAPCDQL